ncbi:hypothetical protein KM043_018796 [Ampulex compressa]|nr:hypothetical protein KM043_018796 [Ampulex compressa]
MDRLTKAELRASAEERGLNPEGTIDQLRARLSQYTRMKSKGRTTTPKLLEADNSALEKIWRWGARFDGREPEELLERLEDLYTGHCDPPADTLKCMAMIMKGPTHRSQKGDRASSTTFGGIRPILRYLGTLIRMYGKETVEKQLDQLFYDLKEDYQRYIHRGSVRTVADFFVLTNEHERPLAIQRERTASRKPRTTEAATIPAGYDLTNYCWRCGQRGHQRQNYRRLGKSFCSRCGTEDQASTKCLWRKPVGNDKAAGPVIAADSSLMVLFETDAKTFAALVDTEANRTYIRGDVARWCLSRETLSTPQLSR